MDLASTSIVGLSIDCVGSPRTMSWGDGFEVSTATFHDPIEHDVQNDFDARRMQRLDHCAKLLALEARKRVGRVGMMGREKI